MTVPGHVLLRPMAAPDLPTVLDIQRACYGEGFLEEAATLHQRLQGPGKLSCVAERSGVVCAYLAAYRSRPGKLTPLHGDFDTVVQPDTLYLHDLAVAPQALGQGLAQRLVSHLWARAAEEGLRYSALVSVQGSQVFWERLGYRAQALDDPAQQQDLATYGVGACYMLTRLGHAGIHVVHRD